MSDDWPNGGYRDEPSQQTRPSFTPRQDPEGSHYEPTQAVPRGSAWPAQPPTRSWPGDGEPPRARGPRGWRRWVRPKAGLNLKKGCQTLNGGQALSFVRTREFPLGDLQREQDQRALLKSLLAKMTSTGTLINPFAVIPAASGAASSLTVDQGTSLTQLVSVAFALRNPVTTMVPFGGFGNSSAGSVVEWNAAAAKVFFHDLATDTPLPKNLITGASVAGTA